MINRRRKKKKLVDGLGSRSGGNTGSNIKGDDDIPAYILQMSDDDPRLLRFMEEVEEERRKHHPNQTHEELIRNVEAILRSRRKSNS